jgi:hypothetical protein
MALKLSMWPEAGHVSLLLHFMEDATMKHPFRGRILFCYSAAYTGVLGRTGNRGVPLTRASVLVWGELRRRKVVLVIETCRLSSLNCTQVSLADQTALLHHAFTQTVRIRLPMLLYG